MKEITKLKKKKKRKEKTISKISLKQKRIDTTMNFQNNCLIDKETQLILIYPEHKYIYHKPKAKLTNIIKDSTDINSLGTNLVKSKIDNHLKKKT